MAILDWIYPKKCLKCSASGVYFCQRCQKSIGRRGKSLRYEGVIRQAIKEIKYRGSYDLVTELVDFWNPEKPEGEVLVTGVPMWAIKQRKRGYNQAELIARCVARKWRAEYLELLIRNRETRPMYGLNERERQDNVRGAFGINYQYSGISDQKTNRKVVLIDDVWTSGATLRECRRVLERASFEGVIEMALAC